MAGLSTRTRPSIPFGEALADRSLPAFLHPGACPDARLEPFYLTNHLGNPYETTVAVAHLIFGDVMGQRPELRILLAHGAGAAAALVGRWERGYSTDRPGVNELTLTPEKP